MINREEDRHATHSILNIDIHPFCKRGNVEPCFRHSTFVRDDEDWIKIWEFFPKKLWNFSSALLPRFERHCYLDRLAMSVTQGGRRMAGGRERWWWRGQIRFAQCDENRGMLLIMEKYPQPREARRKRKGGSQVWSTPPSSSSVLWLPAGIVATVYIYSFCICFSLFVLLHRFPPLSSLFLSLALFQDDAILPVHFLLYFDRYSSAFFSHYFFLFLYKIDAIALFAISVNMSPTPHVITS